MKKLFLAITLNFCINTLKAQQLPCSNPVYRQFDFWIGEWEAFGTDGRKAGTSKVTLILDSCIILEEWTSATVQQGLRYAGKSFNTYNATTKQWQQTWVDNTGGTNEYLQGKFVNDQVIYSSMPFKFNKDTMAIRKMTFTNLSTGKLRQHGEISKDNGISWSTEYDLEYCRKTNTAAAIADTILKGMEEGYNTNQPQKIAAYYAGNAKVVSKNVEITGSENMLRYWKQVTALGGTWKLTGEKAERSGEHIWQKGVSVITDKNGKQHTVNFTLVIIKEDGQWKILQDAYW